MAHREIDTLVIHCSATPNGKFFRTDDIDRWHKEMGFSRNPAWMKRQNPLLGHIGYHFVIYTNGAVATGRHLDEAGAHAKGHNFKSLGICLIGTDKFTHAQWNSLDANVTGLLRYFERRGVKLKVIGHREVNPAKTCPGFDVQAWRANHNAPRMEHIFEEAAHG